MQDKEVINVAFGFCKTEKIVGGGKHFRTKKAGFHAINIGKAIAGTVVAEYQKAFTSDHSEGIIEILKM